MCDHISTFTSTVRIVESTAETLLQTQRIIADFSGPNQKISSDSRGKVRPEYCKLCTMTEEYGLVSKSFLSIFLQCKPFCSTVPLILLMSLVHLGLLFPFLPSHVKTLFLHKGCLASYFYLQLFLFPHIITHSL